MLEPILIGSPDCAAAPPVSAAAIAAATAAAASAELSLKPMSFPPYEPFRDCGRMDGHVLGPLQSQSARLRSLTRVGQRLVDAPPSPTCLRGRVARRAWHRRPPP